MKVGQFPLDPKKEIKIPGVPDKTGYTLGEINRKLIAPAAISSFKAGINKHGNK